MAMNWPGARQPMRPAWQQGMGGTLPPPLAFGSGNPEPPGFGSMNGALGGFGPGMPPGFQPSAAQTTPPSGQGIGPAPNFDVGYAGGAASGDPFNDPVLAGRWALRQYGIDPQFAQGSPFLSTMVDRMDDSITAMAAREMVNGNQALLDPAQRAQMVLSHVGRMLRGEPVMYSGGLGQQVLGGLGQLIQQGRQGVGGLANLAANIYNDPKRQLNTLASLTLAGESPRLAQQLGQNITSLPELVQMAIDNGVTPSAENFLDLWRNQERLNQVRAASRSRQLQPGMY